MLANERQYRIQEILRRHGAVSTSDLVENFGVSIETIRRDLLTMEQKGLLSRVHGGAVSANEMVPFRDLAHRNTEHSDQKKELASYAAVFVQEGDYIAIDTGSTAIYLAEVLRDRFHKLTVATHSLDVFEILRENDGISAILCGGQYLKSENSFYGSLVLDTLEKLHFQKTFLFPSAVSLEFGIADYQQELFQVQKQLLKSSDHIFILADSSKFGKKALLKLDDMKQEYYYVTDSLLSPEQKKLYLENNIQIHNGGNES